MKRLERARLVLEDGRVFRGTRVTGSGMVTGEVVFNTAMTGYQEVLSDPSYAGQIVVLTQPQIGNTGVNAVDMEAVQPLCRGVVVRRMSGRPSSYRATMTLPEWLFHHGVACIEGVDTRAVTHHLRRQGALRGAMEMAAGRSDSAEALERAQREPLMAGSDWAMRVAHAEPRCFSGTGADKHWSPLRPAAPVVPGDPEPVALAARCPFPIPGVPRVVVVDFGVKDGVPEGLVRAGAQVLVVPPTTDASAIAATGADGVVLSNGPGDPAAVLGGDALARSLLGRLPVLGICLGHQLMARALGLCTFKLPFGHHGANHPVQALNTGRVWVTSQNHGFAVAPPAAGQPAIEVTHVSLVDGTVEGFRVPDLRAFAVQFHPEASPGPHDAFGVLDGFVTSLNEVPCPTDLTSTRS